MKVEDYHSAHVARINRRDAKLAVIALIIIFALTIAGWLHTWLVVRPAMQALGERQAAEMQRVDDLLAEASEMLEEVQP